MKVAASTHVGLVRAHNEDTFWYGDNVFVVCDGMGGHQAGEVASQMAVDVIRDYRFSQENTATEIEEAIRLANRRICEAGDAQIEYGGMGTTLTMGVLFDLILTIGHVGDSRAYLVRDCKIQQLTMDHSVVAELVRNGSITQSEALVHPHRHVITQALGAGSIKVDVGSFQLQAHDRLLICSDGLTDVVDDAAIAAVVDAHEPQTSVDLLIDRAVNGGGPDNVTVVIVEV